MPGLVCLPPWGSPWEGWLESPGRGPWCRGDDQQHSEGCHSAVPAPENRGGQGGVTAPAAATAGTLGQPDAGLRGRLGCWGSRVCTLSCGPHRSLGAPHLLPFPIFHGCPHSSHDPESHLCVCSLDNTGQHRPGSNWERAASESPPRRAHVSEDPREGAGRSPLGGLLDGTVSWAEGLQEYGTGSGSWGQGVGARVCGWSPERGGCGERHMCHPGWCWGTPWWHPPLLRCRGRPAG